MAIGPNEGVRSNLHLPHLACSSSSLRQGTPVAYPEFLACWRVSWASFIRLIGAIRGKISAAEEPHYENGQAVPSVDTRDDAVTVRLL